MAKSNENHEPGAGRNGNVPPAEHRWPTGQSGDPAGSSCVGKSAKQWMNVLDDLATPRAELRRIVADETEPPSKRAGAERLLRITESPDMADFEPYLNGSLTLAQLKEKGVNTSLVKKVKERQQFDKEGNVCGVTREIELYDRSGEEFDRVCDRTDGKPTQAVSLDGNLGTPTVIEFITPGPRALAQQGWGE